ncbi:MAG: LysR substrate-binding domain-containing protein, partial [Rubrivivax sp.]|nr:LysR substrate-binding domain-containing protein [Rubrivivax sp.]
MVEAARQMDGGAQRLWRLAQGSDSEQHGPVRLTASQPVACVLLPPLLAQMRLALPQIEVSLVAANSVSNLLRREADIALRMVQPDQASLSTRRIGQVSISACAHADYLQRRGTPARPQDLADHDLIGGDRNDDIERGAIAMGLAPERIRFGLRSDDLLAQWAAVRAGLGVGFIADFVVRTDPAVSTLLPMLGLPRLPIWLTVHREIRSSARIRAVYDFLAERVPAALAA